MSESLLLPKFLTEKMAKYAINCVLRGLESLEHWQFAGTGLLRFPLKKRECRYCEREVVMGHTTVLVPAMKIEVGAEYPHYSLEPHVLYGHDMHKMCGASSIAADLAWPHPFDEIAQCKAVQLWQGRNDGRTGIVPHLLYSDDTPFWGGVKREGIVVAHSGDKCHIDMMISGMIADMCVAMAHEAWLESDDKSEDANFLT